jgi:hypothetical protein
VGFRIADYQLPNTHQLPLGGTDLTSEHVHLSRGVRQALGKEIMESPNAGLLKREQYNELESTFE